MHDMLLLKLAGGLIPLFRGFAMSRLCKRCSQGCSYLQQISDKDLGRRMAAAMEHALANGAQKVLPASY